MLSNLVSLRRQLLLAMSLVLISLIFTHQGIARADVSSVSVSPASWAPGSSQAATITLNVTGTVVGSVGFWQNTGSRTWSLSSTGESNGTLSGNVLTCATSGVTYTSTLFSGWGDGVKNNVCENGQNSTYLEVGFFGGARPNGAGIIGPGTIQINLPAGFFTAPSVIGSTTFQAYAIESFSAIVRTNFELTVAEAATEPESDLAIVNPLLQQVGLPGSGDCEQVDDSDLGWGTGLSGGWGKSWAQWVNGGMGGPVCTRAFVFQRGVQRWSIL